MNKSEEKIYNEIIDRVKSNNNSYKYKLDLFGGDIEKFKKSILYKPLYTYLDYLDGRKNLITINNFCKYTGEKIDKNKIKKELNNYFN